MGPVKSQHAIRAATHAAEPAGRGGPVTLAAAPSLRMVMRAPDTALEPACHHRACQHRACHRQARNHWAGGPESGPTVCATHGRRPAPLRPPGSMAPGRRGSERAGADRVKLSTRSGSGASQSCVDVAQVAGPHLLPGPCAPSGRPPAGLRILLARRAWMLRSAQTTPEVTQHSMIIETWTSPPGTALGPRSLVIIYPRGHQGRSRKARCPLGNRAEVAMSRACWRSHHAAAWR
jgi:hypothetical protein